MPQTTVEALLDTLVEELAEVIQRVEKAKRFGLDEVQPGQDLNNLQRMNIEWNDVLALVELLADDHNVRLFRTDELVRAHKNQVRYFLKYSRERGRVSDE